jgi:hypothetical protein
MTDHKVLSHCHTPDCGPGHTYLELSCGHWAFVLKSSAPPVGTDVACEQCSKQPPENESQ